MLELSANSDYTTKDTFKLTNEYYDWDSTFSSTELWGADALNQSIEMVLTTEPQERLFNLNFGTPLYALLFENEGDVTTIMDNVFTNIEYWVPIKIDRSRTNVQVDADNHAVSFQIPYVSNNGVISGLFARRLHG